MREGSLRETADAVSKCRNTFKIAIGAEFKLRLAYFLCPIALRAFDAGSVAG